MKVSSPLCRPNSSRAFRPTSTAISLRGTLADFDAEIHGQGEQLLLVPDFITAHIAFTDGQDQFGNGTAVVGVGRRAGGDHPDEIARGDGLGGGSADAAALALLFRGFGVFPLASGTRQGPIAQTLQQLPTSPMGQGFIAAARSNDRLTPSHAAFSIICRVAGSILFFFSVSAISFLHNLTGRLVR